MRIKIKRNTVISGLGRVERGDIIEDVSLKDGRLLVHLGKAEIIDKEDVDKVYPKKLSTAAYGLEEKEDKPKPKKRKKKKEEKKHEPTENKE